MGVHWNKVVYDDELSYENDLTGPEPGGAPGLRPYVLVVLPA
jgi:hypothetical protein